jgi:hypothetical protein
VFFLDRKKIIKENKAIIESIRIASQKKNIKAEGFNDLLDLALLTNENPKTDIEELYEINRVLIKFIKDGVDSAQRKNNERTNELSPKMRIVQQEVQVHQIHNQ